MPNNGKTFVLEFWKISVLVVVLSALILFYLNYVIDASALNKTAIMVKYEWLDARFALAIGFLTALVAFLLGGFLLGETEKKAREEELKRVVVDPLAACFKEGRCKLCPTLDDVDWEVAFKDAQQVYLIVQGWDGWTTKANKGLKQFLQRNGKIFLLTHNPNNAALMRSHGERLASKKDPKAEIENMVENLKRAIRETAGAKMESKLLQADTTEKINWFCAVFFQPTGKLLLSPYQHRHHNFDMPWFIIEREDSPNVCTWFVNEWKELNPSVDPSKP